MRPWSSLQPRRWVVVFCELNHTRSPTERRGPVSVSCLPDLNIDAVLLRFQTVGVPWFPWTWWRDPLYCMFPSGPSFPLGFGALVGKGQITKVDLVHRCKEWWYACGFWCLVVTSEFQRCPPIVVDVAADSIQFSVCPSASVWNRVDRSRLVLKILRRAFQNVVCLSMLCMLCPSSIQEPERLDL